MSVVRQWENMHTYIVRFNLGIVFVWRRKHTYYCFVHLFSIRMEKLGDNRHIYCLKGLSHFNIRFELR